MELHDAGAQERMGGEGVRAVAALVDDQDVEAGAGEEQGGRRAGGAGADDDDVVASGRWGGAHGRPLGFGGASDGGWSEASGGDGLVGLEPAGDVAGDVGGVVAHAVDEVGVAAVLEPLPEHVQPGVRA